MQNEFSYVCADILFNFKLPSSNVKTNLKEYSTYWFCRFFKCKSVEIQISHELLILIILNYINIKKICPSGDIP